MDEQQKKTIAASQEETDTITTEQEIELKLRKEQKSIYDQYDAGVDSEDDHTFFQSRLKQIKEELDILARGEDLQLYRWEKELKEIEEQEWKDFNGEGNPDTDWEYVEHRKQCLQADIFGRREAAAAIERGDEDMAPNPYERGLG